jgi:hypothetical protein
MNLSEVRISNLANQADADEVLHHGYSLCGGINKENNRANWNVKKQDRKQQAESFGTRIAPSELDSVQQRIPSSNLIPRN